MKRNHNKSELKKLDAAHHLHPFTDHPALEEWGGTRIMVSAKGSIITDIDGNEIIDGMAGLWTTAIGYGREELAQVAYDQIKELCFYNTFFKTAHPPVIELSQKICELLGKDFGKIFYGSSGSESNDTVIKIVRRYWQVKNKSYRNIIISRKNGYHGSTIGGTSLGGMGYMHAQTQLLVPGIVHINQPYFYGEAPAGMSADDFGIQCARELEEKILEVGPDNVAAFIGEPVQGAGGVIIPPKTYWQEIQRICTKYDILLVSDEVICGFGRLGEWFGFQHFGFKPDVVTMAKALTSGYIPMSAVAVNNKVAKVAMADGGEFNHGYTYSGHPVAAAVALKNIAIMENEHLVSRAKNEMADYIAKKLQELTDLPIVGEVRSLGMIGAIELVKDKKTKERFPNLGTAGTICRDHFFKNNAIMRATRDTMLFCPPLVITKDEIDKIMAIARKCLIATWGRCAKNLIFGNYFTLTR